MKRGCSHRWRDIWASHAGLRPISDIRAAAAVEFALVLWPLLLLVLGAVDGGRMVWTQNSLQYAVEQAARYAGLNKAACSTGPTVCYTPAQIQSYAASMANGMSLSPSVFSSTSAGCGAVAGTQVSASFSYSPLFPFPSNVTLTASSCRPT
jgi:Flp pilus assembly protein TadG